MNDKLEQRAFILLLVTISALFFFLIKPFFASVFWACAIALVFYPVQQRLIRRWAHRPNLSALATLFICIVVVVIPVLLILTSFVQEAAGLYQRISSGELKPESLLDHVRDALPAVNALLDRFGLDLDSLKEQAASGAVAASRFIAKNAVSLGQSTFQFFLNLVLMLYLMFFLLRDGSALVDKLTHALPFGDERERLMFSKFAEVTRATIKGNLVVAMVQGALGGIIFWLLGIPGPILWGVVMAVLSLIPAVGAGLIWLPAAIFLFATGDTVEAIILVLYGVLVIGLADNVLRPILVGRDTKLPDWLVLLSTLGGLVLFGINGFVIGPVIAALFVVVWQIFSRDFNHATRIIAEPESFATPEDGAGEATEKSD
ncbi:MAG: AI-2E family transporter [Porticoccaceae bacterium]|nr:AI-2E family transporter [Porticoccaceae bacterium]